MLPRLTHILAKARNTRRGAKRKHLKHGDDNRQRSGVQEEQKRLGELPVGARGRLGGGPCRAVGRAPCQHVPRTHSGEVECLVSVVHV